MPKKYRKTTDTHNENIVPENDDIQFKGTPVQYDKLRQYLIELLNYSDMSRNMIKGHQIYDKIKYVECAVSATIDKESEYKIITNMVEEIWKDKKDSIKPGTVGSMIYGCLLSECECNDLCADAIVRRNKNGICKNLVLRANQNINGSISFEVMNEGVGTNKNAIIYMNGEFNGFSDSEKLELKNRGVDKIQIIDNNSKNRTPDDSRYIDLNNIQKRVSSTVSKPFYSQIWFWVLMIIIILLIIFLVFKNRKQKNIVVHKKTWKVE